MRPSLNKPTLLIVDDDEHLRYLFAAAATRCGEYATVWQAGDGRAALEILRKMPEVGRDGGRSVFVLSDLCMPVMDGLELVHAIKNDVNTRGVPVAIMTSSDRPNAKTDALAAGCCAFLAKPERLDLITEMIASLPLLCESKVGEAAH